MMSSALAGILQQQAPSSAFVPTDIAGCTAWWDASDTGTITVASNLVSQWDDKSGNAWHLASSVDANKLKSGLSTQNGLNVITCEANRFLTYDAGSDAIDIDPLTVFIVAYDDNSTQTSSTYRRPLSSRRSATGAADFQSPNLAVAKNNLTRAIQINGNGATGPTHVAYTNQDWFVFTGQTSSSGASVQVDNGTATTQGSNHAVGAQRYVRVGADCRSISNPPAIETSITSWIGFIAEVIMYNATLDATDRTTVYDYLVAKWGL